MEALLSRQKFESRQNLNESKMANSKEMQGAIIQAAMIAGRPMKKAKPPAELHARKSIPEENHRLKQARPMMSQPAFNLKLPGRYMELLNFEMADSKCALSRNA